MGRGGKGKGRPKAATGQGKAKAGPSTAAPTPPDEFSEKYDEKFDEEFDEKFDDPFDDEKFDDEKFDDEKFDEEKFDEDFEADEKFDEDFDKDFEKEKSESFDEDFDADEKFDEDFDKSDKFEEDFDNEESMKLEDDFEEDEEEKSETFEEDFDKEKSGSFEEEFEEDKSEDFEEEFDEEKSGSFDKSESFEEDSAKSGEFEEDEDSFEKSESAGFEKDSDDFEEDSDKGLEAASDDFEKEEEDEFEPDSDDFEAESETKPRSAPKPKKEKPVQMMQGAGKVLGRIAKIMAETEEALSDEDRRLWYLFLKMDRDVTGYLDELGIVQLYETVGVDDEPDRVTVQGKRGRGEKIDFCEFLAWYYGNDDPDAPVREALQMYLGDKERQEDEDRRRGVSLDGPADKVRFTTATYVGRARGFDARVLVKLEKFYIDLRARLLALKHDLELHEIYDRIDEKCGLRRVWINAIMRLYDQLGSDQFSEDQLVVFHEFVLADEKMNLQLRREACQTVVSRMLMLSDPKRPDFTNPTQRRNDFSNTTAEIHARRVKLQRKYEKQAQPYLDELFDQKKGRQVCSWDRFLGWYDSKSDFDLGGINYDDPNLKDLLHPPNAVQSKLWKADMGNLEGFHRLLMKLVPDAAVEDDLDRIDDKKYGANIERVSAYAKCSRDFLSGQGPAADQVLLAFEVFTAHDRKCRSLLDRDEMIAAFQKMGVPEKKVPAVERMNFFRFYTEVVRLQAKGAIEKRDTSSFWGSCFACLSVNMSLFDPVKSNAKNCDHLEAKRAEIAYKTLWSSILYWSCDQPIKPNKKPKKVSKPIVEVKAVLR